MTPYFQLDIIEIRKAIQEYEENSSDEVLQWIKFLDDFEDKEIERIVKENNNIKEAKEELSAFSKDNTLRWLALREEITRIDNE